MTLNATSDKLNAAATECGWNTSRIRANEGKVRVDYFAHTKTLLKVVYDSRGRLSEANFYDGTRRLGRSQHVGSGDADKTKTVLAWIKSRSK